MNKLILTQGISGSGKTTWAKKWVEEDPTHRIRLNYDDIRCMLGKYWVPEREPLVKKIFDTALGSALSVGYDIVIDNMSNLNPKHQEEYRKLIDNWNNKNTNKYEIEFRVFDTPVEICIERDSKREIPIGEKVIRQQWRQYRTYIIQHSIKEMLDNQLIQDTSLPHCIIVDMDATLCFNTSGRPFWGAEADYRVVDDIPNTPIVELVKHYKNASNNIIIITGRSDSSRTGTELWLKKYGVPYDKILMRKEGDMTKGEELKQMLYENEVKGAYYVDFVLEDSYKVVQMYRNLGLTVLQPNEGKF